MEKTVISSEDLANLRLLEESAKRINAEKRALQAEAALIMAHKNSVLSAMTDKYGKDGYTMSVDIDTGEVSYTEKNEER